MCFTWRNAFLFGRNLYNQADFKQDREPDIHIVYAKEACVLVVLGK